MILLCLRVLWQWYQLRLPPRESDFIDLCQWHHLAGTWRNTETGQLGGVSCLSLQAKSENYPFLFSHLREEMLPRCSSMSTIAWLVPLFNVWHPATLRRELKHPPPHLGDREHPRAPRSPALSWNLAFIFQNFSSNLNFIFLKLLLLLLFEVRVILLVCP